MAHNVVELHDNEKEITISADVLPKINEPSLLELLKLVKLFDKGVSIAEITFEKQSDDSLDYSYVVEAKDGRIWEQPIIRYENNKDTDPAMNFSGVEDLWKLSEFRLGRDVRKKLIDMAIEFRLDLLKIEFH